MISICYRPCVQVYEIPCNGMVLKAAAKRKLLITRRHTCIYLVHTHTRSNKQCRHSTPYKHTCTHKVWFDSVMAQVTDFDLAYFQFDLKDLDKISTQDLCRIEEGAELPALWLFLDVFYIDSNIVQRIPFNSRKQTSWSVSLFNEWAQWRHKQGNSMLDTLYAILELENKHGF